MFEESSKSVDCFAYEQRRVSESDLKDMKEKVEFVDYDFREGDQSADERNKNDTIFRILDKSDRKGFFTLSPDERQI